MNTLAQQINSLLAHCIEHPSYTNKDKEYIEKEIFVQTSGEKQFEMVTNLYNSIKSR